MSYERQDFYAALRLRKPFIINSLEGAGGRLIDQWVPRGAGSYHTCNFM